MEKIYIISGKRTAIGKFLGGLSDVKPGDMGSTVAKAVIDDAGIDPAFIDEIYIGHQHSPGQGPSIARKIGILAGIPPEIPATTVNMQCGSGMKALICGINSIRAGASVILCGGVENMSQVPFILTDKARKGVKMGNAALNVQDSLFCDGLIDQFYGYPMGMTAENVAEKIGVTREEQDRYALLSQNRAQQAVEGGQFCEEIVAIEHLGKRGESLRFDRDEAFTPGSTIEGLQRLRPVFKAEGGTVTAGNSSQLNDGAAMMLLASETAVREYDLKPLAEVISVGQRGIDPSIMGLGPVGAINIALEKAKIMLQDIPLIELNEAFAAQALGVLKELQRIHGITVADLLEKTNVNGGAIALGHPVAASGTRIVVSLLHEMKRRENAEYGLASLCIGGGMGIAMIIRKC